MKATTTTIAPEVIVTSVTVDEVPALRKEVAEAGVRQYGAERKYALALCEALPAEWYAVEHSDTSDTAKITHTEKQALYAELKAAKHTNPSTVWARVRKYARDFIEGEAAKSTAAAGGAIGEDASTGNARHTRSLTLRMVEELTSLYKAAKREVGLSTAQQGALVGISAALGALGVELSTL